MQITDRIHHFSTLRNLVALLLLTVATAFVMMGIIQPQMNAITGGSQILDVRIIYDYDDAMALLTALGPDGRQLYSLHQIVDCIFPLAYGASMMIALDLLVTRVPWAKTRHGRVVILPVLAMVLDYSENILLATQVAAFPNLSPEVVAVAGLTTLAKWFFILLSFAALALLAVCSKSRKDV